ncbi:MAG: TonB-dependent receptor [Pseudomonadota bacterium]
MRNLSQWALAGLLILGLNGLVAAPYAHAQQSTLQDYDIPVQSLGKALLQFAEQSGLEILFDARIAQGKEAPAVIGSFTAEQVLQQLLNGSGLVFRFTTPSKVALEPEAGSGSSNAVDLDAIVVKGELLQRDLQETQTSVTVESGLKLDRSTDKDIFDVVDRLPNVSAQGGGFGFVIRGISPSGPAASGDGAAIAVIVDGAVVPVGQATNTGSTSTWDLEQIEVLRGPQSTQQGPNAIAGAVIMRSKDPTFEKEFKARTDIATLGEERIALAGNLPINDSVAIRLSGETYESEGDIENYLTGEETGDESLETLRAKIRFNPDDDLDIVFGHSVSDNQLGDQSVIDGMIAGGFTADAKDRLSSQRFLEIGETDITNLRVDYTLNDQWSLHSETAILNSDYDLDVPLQPGNPANTPAFRTVDDETTSQEIKFLFDDENFRAVVGLYYLDTDKQVDFGAIIPDATGFGFPGASAVFGNGLDVQLQNQAIFGEIEYDFDDRWTGIFGARHDEEERESLATAAFTVTPEPFPGFNDPAPGTDLDTPYSALLPKLGAIYNWDDNLSTGFTVQRGYRAGGVSTFTGGVNEYDPEFSTNYEFSLRSVSKNRRLTINANVFYTDYEDLQVFSVGPPSFTFIDGLTDNASSGKLYGFELLVDYVVNPSFDIFANIGFTKTEFGDYVVQVNPTFYPGVADIDTDGDSVNDAVNVEGNSFVEAPELTWSIGGRYDFENGYEAEMDINFTDSSFYSPINSDDEENKPFTLVNARVGYVSRDFWSAHLYARNLFDEQYRSRNRADGFSTIGDSRVVGISLNAEF